MIKMNTGMMTYPQDEQLTIHFHNYEVHFGIGRFYVDLQLAQLSPLNSSYSVMKTFILHYGLDTINIFLKEYKLAC